MTYLFKEPVLCPTCGAKAKKHTDNHFIAREGAPYKGNMKVIRNHYHSYYDEDGTLKKELSSQDIWDGETYYHRYGNFCKYRCAVTYANIVVNRIKGIKLKPEDEDPEEQLGKQIYSGAFMNKKVDTEK